MTDGPVPEPQVGADSVEAGPDLDLNVNGGDPEPDDPDDPGPAVEAPISETNGADGAPVDQ